MDFGVVLQTNPPASGVIAMMQRAEEAGFSYGWTWDSHVLWQEPFVIYSRILSATSAMTVGPMVTNPGTRDWSVIASLFATLNDMYGNRTVCGIGRGDSARRVIGQRLVPPPAVPPAQHPVVVAEPRCPRVGEVAEPTAPHNIPTLPLGWSLRACVSDHSGGKVG